MRRYRASRYAIARRLKRTRWRLFSKENDPRPLNGSSSKAESSPSRRKNIGIRNLSAKIHRAKIRNTITGDRRRDDARDTPEGQLNPLVR